MANLRMAARRLLNKYRMRSRGLRSGLVIVWLETYSLLGHPRGHGRP